MLHCVWPNGVHRMCGVESENYSETHARLPFTNLFCTQMPRTGCQTVSKRFTEECGSMKTCTLHTMHNANSRDSKSERLQPSKALPSTSCIWIRKFRLFHLRRVEKWWTTTKSWKNCHKHRTNHADGFHFMWLRSMSMVSFVYHLQW